MSFRVEREDDETEARHRAAYLQAIKANRARGVGGPDALGHDPATTPTEEQSKLSERAAQPVPAYVPRPAHRPSIWKRAKKVAWEVAVVLLVLLILGGSNVPIRGAG